MGRANQSSYPRLCAHRGLSHACPENTLPALAAAIACGAPEIEFDLRPSADGEIVVFHDPIVDRTTGGSGVVREMDLETLKQLDAGWAWGELWKGIRIPTLQEALCLANGRVVMNLHIKDTGEDGEVIRRTAGLLRERGLVDAAYFALHSEDALLFAADYAPEINRACLSGQNDPATQLNIALRTNCARVQFRRTVDTSIIDSAKTAGLICNLFWSDEPCDAAEFVSSGIDVILTNRANLLMGSAPFAPL